MVANLWDFLGNFNDRDGFRILVLLMVLFGVQIVIGVWATRQVRTGQRVLETQATGGEPIGG